MYRGLKGGWGEIRQRVTLPILCLGRFRRYCSQRRIVRHYSLCEGIDKRKIIVSVFFLYPRFGFELSLRSKTDFWNGGECNTTPNEK